MSCFNTHIKQQAKQRLRAILILVVFIEGNPHWLCAGRPRNQFRFPTGPKDSPFP